MRRCVCVLGPGPSHWADTWSACDGTKQSPINIEPSKATKKELGSLTLQGYDVADGHVFELLNNGHTGRYIASTTAHQLQRIDYDLSGPQLSVARILSKVHFFAKKVDDFF